MFNPSRSNQPHYDPAGEVLFLTYDMIIMQSDMMNYLYHSRSQFRIVPQASICFMNRYKVWIDCLRMTSVSMILYAVLLQIPDLLKNLLQAISLMALYLNISYEVENDCVADRSFFFI